MALSEDLRKRVVEAVVREGMSRNAAAKRFGGQHRQRRALVAAVRRHGRDFPGSNGGDRRSGRIEAHRDYLLGLIRASRTCAAGNPGTPDRHLRRAFLFLRDLALLSIAMGSRFKKSPRMLREQQRADVLKQRMTGSPHSSSLDPSKLVFIDETGAFHQFGAQRRTLPTRSTVARRHSARPLQDHHAVAGLRLSGLVAQKAFDQPMNAAKFEEWVEKCLVPTSRKATSS